MSGEMQLEVRQNESSERRRSKYMLDILLWSKVMPIVYLSCQVPPVQHEQRLRGEWRGAEGVYWKQRSSGERAGLASAQAQLPCVAVTGIARTR